MVKTFKNKGIEALRWSQKYTGVDMVYLARGGFWLGLQQFMVTLAAFILSIIMANYVSKTDFGNYRFVLSILNILILASLPGLSIAITRSVANKEIEKVNYLGIAKIRWGLFGTLAGFLIAGYYFLNANGVLGWSFVFVALALPFFDTPLIYEHWLRGKEKFRKVSVYRSLTQIIFTIFFGVYIYIFSPPVIWMIFWYLFGFTILRSFFYIKTFGFPNLSFNKVFKTGTKPEKETLAYGKHLSAMNALTIIFLAVDKVVVFHFLGATSLAIYAFALSLPDQIKAALKQIISVAMPKLAERKYEDIKRTALKRLLILLSGVSLMVVVYILLAPLMYGLFFPQYMESVLLSQVVALAIIPNAGVFFVRTIFNAQMKTTLQYIFSIIYPIIQTILLLVGFFIGGMIGMIIGFVIAQYIGLALALQLLYFKK